MGIIYTIIIIYSFVSNRWFAQRYGSSNAWSFGGLDGVLNGIYCTYECTVQAVALLKV